MAEGAHERGDLEWGTTPRLVHSSAARFGDAVALADEGTELSFRDLAAAVARAGRAFVATGLQPGDRVSIWAPNVHEWVVAALGLQAAGGVLVPLNTRFKGHEAGYVLAKSGAKVLVTVTGFLDTDYVGLLREANGDRDGDRPVKGLPDLEQVVVLRGEAPDGTLGWDEFLARADGVSAEEAERRADAVRPDDVSDILFTSGTTGHPKGAMATHAQTLRAYRDWSEVVGLRAGDRYLVVNPFFHGFGYKAGWLASLMMGATVIPHAVFEPGAVMARVAAEGVTVLPGPPTLYQAILDHPDRTAHDLSSLRLAVTGAAVIPVELIHRMRRELTFDTIITGYGLTESTGIATMCRYDDDPETIATTSGRAIPGVEVRVVDDAGAEVPRGEPGEIVIRGYNVMQGYYDEPDETAAAVDGDGWLHTGDVGVMDERGYVRITDRKKDLFIVGGFNAYPAEIENAMLGHDSIAQVAVVGVPDERMGEVGLAFVVLRPGQEASADEIVAWCRERMANYKVPRHVEVVDALPLNAMGKVLKYQLREQGTEIRAKE
jgi:acyl-CoA synthetase (AMP-forming)/AMP-acid ligase II